MITIDQLLESVDLDFEPRFVTKDKSGIITIWADKPSKDFASNTWIEQTDFVVIHLIKLADFENKDWQECIYEVPRKDKPVVKIEKLQPTVRGFDEKPSMPTATDFLNKINEIIDWINDNHKDSK